MTGGRPAVDRPAVKLPAWPGSDPIWEALLELAGSGGPEWTLIGGQMVMLHAAENGAAPLRVSRDIDVVVNTRIVTGALRGFAAGLEERGFGLTGASPDGIAHRYTRGEASIDVLAPEGLGERADRTELLPVAHAGRQGLVPRPSLLGAVVVKAAAIPVDDAPRSQEQDLALLLSMVADPSAMAAEMTRKDRRRLRRAGLESPDHPVWGALDPDAADRARIAYLSLSDPPAAAPASR